MPQRSLVADWPGCRSHSRTTIGYYGISGGGQTVKRAGQAQDRKILHSHLSLQKNEIIAVDQLVSASITKRRADRLGLFALDPPGILSIIGREAFS